MSTFTLTIDCGNAAFFDAFDANGNDHLSARGDEVARILRNLADKVQDGYQAVYLNDANGNVVGAAQFHNEGGDHAQ